MDDIDELDRDLWERIRTLDLAAKVRLLSGQDKWRTWPEPAIGLHEIVMADSMVGVRGRHWTETDPSANTPSATATAATFDPEVAYELGRIVGAEARRKQVDVVLGPVVNLQRSPYGGRSFEGFGEDPQLAAVLAAAMVHGIEDEGVATTVKHFLANESETNRTTSNSVVDEQTLREVYLLPFEAVVQAGGQGDDVGLQPSQ
jgi:beta-glucosidase